MDAYTAITTLRAIRQYRDAQVDDAIITRILEAGRWAGSAKNTQPWHYILVTRRDTLNHDVLASLGRKPPSELVSRDTWARPHISDEKAPAG